MTIAIIKGNSQNNVLREFSELIAEGFNSLNTPYTVIDLTLENSVEDLTGLINNRKLDGILSFNGMLGDVLPDNFNIPFVGWFVDAPHYHLSRLQHVGGVRHYIFASKHHINLIKQAKIKARSSILLAGARGFNDNLKESFERSRTILLAASWMGEPKEFWTQYASENDRKIAKKVIEILDEDQRVDALLACNTAANLMKIKFNLDSSWTTLASLAQTYIRQKDRIKIVKTIASEGLPFTLIGQGWKSNVKLGSNVDLVDDLDFKNIFDFYKKSRIVFNINSSNGACERLFDAVSAGACVISDYSDSLLSIFKDRKDFCLFDRRKPASIIDSIEYLMNDDKWNLMSIRSRKIINDKHLWIHRAQELIEIFESIKLYGSK